VKGICIARDCKIDGERPACKKARWWTETFGLSAPFGVPLLSPREGSEPVCMDCTMFQEEVKP